MTSHDIESYFREHRRLLVVLIMVIFMTAISGVFVGMRQTSTGTSAARDHTGHSAGTMADGSAKIAPRYGDIPDTDWLANANWRFTLEQLPQASTTADVANPLAAEELAEVLAFRSERRAFDGAPPTIPHDVNPTSPASCISCHSHESRLVIGNTRPSAMSHPYYANCTQCHVPADGLRTLTEDVLLAVDSTFEGRSSPGPGCRAYPGAPPTMPHAVHMRQNCMSCHAPDRPNAIRSSHPQRRNCLQCHAQNADYDNRERVLESSPPLDP